MKRGVVINQWSNLKNLEREQNKPKPSRKKEQINTDRHQWSWTQAKKKKKGEKMKQSLLFKDINKIDKCLARLTKKWGEKGTRCRIRYETYHYRSININKVSEYYEQLSTVITILMSILWFCIMLLLRQTIHGMYINIRQYMFDFNFSEQIDWDCRLWTDHRETLKDRIKNLEYIL